MSAGHAWRPMHKWLLVLLLAVLVAWAAVQTKGWLVSASEKRLLVSMAEQFLEAVYAGNLSDAAAMTAGELRDDILAGVDPALAGVKGKKLQSMTLSAFSVTSRDSRLVVLQIYEVPFSTVLFKGITFQRLGDRWLITSIAHDA